MKGVNKMEFQEPKMEFVPIDLTDAIACSPCPNAEVQASYEMCGCTDSVTTGQVPCGDIV